MINDILTAIAARLGAEVPELKYIDEDWGQLDDYSDNPPVKFPCAIIEVQQAAWRNQSNKVQDGTVNISIRVAELRLSNTNLRAPAPQKLNAAAIWLIQEKIYKALHTWRPVEFPAFSSLTRVSSRKLKRDDGVREFEMIFTTVYVDKAAVVLPTMLPDVPRVIGINE
ncbi:MAG: hypothetical protein FD170_3971 [Bacteroidetes bacterium]|nr:MAG: hypothetical protein FD170_3971 [Bacteroidota bacterium]